MRKRGGARDPAALPAFLGLGSNLGNRARTLAAALRMLDAHTGLELRQVSSVYETAPLGVTDQPWFLNMVARLDCGLAPMELLDAVQEVERRLGRVRARRWGPRSMDVDLLLLGDLSIQTPRLTVPHPELARRQFVLVPLAEIAPDLVLPGGRTAGDLAEGESETVRRLGPLADLVGGRETEEGGKT